MKNLKRVVESVVLAIALIAGILLFAIGNLFFIPGIQYSVYQSVTSKSQLKDSSLVQEKEIKALNQNVVALNRKLERLTPGNAFLVINTTENTFKLFKNNQLIRTGLCSTGSFVQLEVDSAKSWTFETPKGVLTVKGKITNPVWKKPDWAFIEEGLPVPPQNHPSRYERNVLGDYALSLGNGYLIHGTLYQRLLGLPVTHGCVRLDDSDLQQVYNTLQLGSKVFIY